MELNLLLYLRDMNQILYRILICLLLLKAAATTDASDGGPLNQAAILGRNISLTCREVNPPGKGVMWMFYAVGEQSLPTIIYSDFTLHLREDRVRVARSDGMNHLIINETQPNDAGTYVCISGSRTFKAQLVILESNPVCQIYSTNTKESAYGTKTTALEASCSVQFWGNWSPTMGWSIDGGRFTPSPRTNQSDPGTGGNTTLTSVVQISIDPYDSTSGGCFVTCQTNFTTDNKPWMKDGSTSVPDYFYTWMSPDVSINSKRPATDDGIRATSPVWKIETSVSHQRDILIAVICVLVFILVMVVLIACCRHKYQVKHCKLGVSVSPGTQTFERSNIEDGRKRDLSPVQGTYETINELEMVPNLRLEEGTSPVYQGSSVYYDGLRSPLPLPTQSEDGSPTNDLYTNTKSGSDLDRTYTGLVDNRGEHLELPTAITDLPRYSDPPKRDDSNGGEYVDLLNESISQSGNHDPFSPTDPRSVVCGASNDPASGRNDERSSSSKVAPDVTYLQPDGIRETTAGSHRSDSRYVQMKGILPNKPASKDRAGEVETKAELSVGGNLGGTKDQFASSAIDDVRAAGAMTDRPAEAHYSNVGHEAGK